MTSTTEAERWVFTKDELRNTPSQRAGVDHSKETQYRFDGCSFISSAGQKLNVPQHTIATAQVYFHRFYMYRSFVKYEKKGMASCCLFLAGKVEDTPKRLNDILAVSYYLERRGDANIRKEDLVLDVNSKEYWTRKKKLLQNERVLLQTLGFDLEVEHPYNKMLEKCRILGTSKPVAQLAWNLINDSLRGTTICLEVGPDLVSTAVIRLAAQERKYEDQIRKPTDGREWWQAITMRPRNVTNEDMENTMLIIKSMFSKQSRLSANADKEKDKKKALSLEDYKRKQAHRTTGTGSPPTQSTEPKASPPVPQSESTAAGMNPVEPRKDVNAAEPKNETLQPGIVPQGERPSKRPISEVDPR